jgi:hypothetical protein
MECGRNTAQRVNSAFRAFRIRLVLQCSESRAAIHFHLAVGVADDKGVVSAHPGTRAVGGCNFHAVGAPTDSRVAPSLRLTSIWAFAGQFEGTPVSETFSK